MIRLPEMIGMQKKHVEHYRETAASFVEKEISIICEPTWVVCDPLLIFRR